MKVAIGSKNPVKIQAVKNAFSKYFSDAEFEDLEVESGVSNQPFHEEVEKGALNRAKNAFKNVNCDYAVGLEGGVAELYAKHYVTSYVAITNGLETRGAYSGMLECPEFVLKKLKSGMELGEVMDEHTGRKDTKKAEGMIGIFSKGVITREESFTKAVICALVPFLNKEKYAMP